MEGDEGGIFSKAQHWKPLFLLKIETEQSLDCKNKKQNLIFKYSHQNITAYPRSKKNWINECWGNIAYLEESEQSEMLLNKFSFSQIHLEFLQRVATPGKFYSFSHHLETVFSALKLEHNCYMNMDISFYWKMAVQS